MDSSEAQEISDEAAAGQQGKREAMNAGTSARLTVTNPPTTPPRQCEPLDEQETRLLDEVARNYFQQAAADMRSRVGLRPAERGSNVVPNQQQIDSLCTLDYSIRGVVAHAEKIRMFKNLPDKVTLPQDQTCYLKVFFRLNEVLEDLEDIAQRIEKLPK